MRNRELVYLVICYVCIFLVGILGIGLYPDWSMAIFGIAMFFCTFIFLAQNRYRYQKIRKLNGLLTQIQNENASIEWQEYKEGELSMLYTQLVKVTNLLVEQRESILRDKNYLKDVLSDISHQLKTPMTSMMVMVDLLREGNLPEEKREEFTQSITKQLERMEWLISILLKMSKLDARTITLVNRPVSAGELFDRAMAHLLIPMELRGVACHMEHQEVSLVVDAHWMSEALTNIIKNCMEHTEAGGWIRLWAEDNPLYYGIHIQDNGCGIAADDLPHIFERFYRGKNADSDSIGIGLAFARQIITLEKGKIQVESSVGEGTHFHIKLYKVTKLS